MTFNTELFKQISGLILFSLLLLGCHSVYLHQGLSAVFVILVVMLLLVAVKLLGIHQRNQQQIEQVISALANNDPTLGLPRSSFLYDKVVQVQHQIQNNRVEAEVQAQYLQTLLVHLDISILVVDKDNKVVMKNPASEQLLGQLPTKIGEALDERTGEKNNSLGQLGELITTSDKSLRATIPWQQGEHLDTLRVHISCCDIQGEALKLVSIQSIYQVLVAKEQQAYKQLTRVLTHEVANSITPLASLASTSLDLLPQALVFDDPEDKEDLIEALQTLASRASHLSAFIKSFHQITALPKPSLNALELPPIIERVLILFKTQARTQNIQLTFDVQSTCLLMADAAQLEQVLINIIKNAFEALKKCDAKTVTLKLYQQSHQNARHQLLLDIQDSGPGIAPHVKDQIFVPFFTTKKKGSGIGLALSRQIMVQHGGDLRYVYKEDCKGSSGCFRLEFGMF